MPPLPVPFSPRAWGWSGYCSSGRISRRVLPTCVGMVRNIAWRMATMAAFSPRAWGWSRDLQPARARVRRSPHVRGDGPQYCVANRLQWQRSPHVRGDGPLAATPAPASERSPHVRGDGPSVVGSQRSVWLFSPRAWGWSRSGDMWERSAPYVVRNLWLADHHRSRQSRLQMHRLTNTDVSVS